MSQDITNDELMRRLKLLNYSAPPITPSTRNVLLKKLAQLEAEAKQKQLKNRTKGTNGSQRLLDYSSGEEDAASSLTVSAGVRRRTSAPRQPQATSSSTVTSRQARANGHSSNSRLMNYSENEDEDVDDDDEEDEEEEEEEDEDDSENENESRKSFAIQTSFDCSSPSLLDTNLITPDTSARFGVRFKSSTPMTASKSTPTSTTTTSSRTLRGHPASSTTTTPAIQSPLRRAIAKNEKAFGSLGEALDSLPGLSSSSKSSLSNGSASKPIGTTVVTSVSRDAAKAESYGKRPTGFCSSHLVSKLIICIVAFFFLYLTYKYMTLRPNVDISQRLPLCSESQDDQKSCVTVSQVESVAEMYRRLVMRLEDHQSCSYEPSEALNLEQLRQELGFGSDAERDVDESYDGMVEQEERTANWKVLQLLVRILEENPKLGISVIHNQDIQLSLTQPHLPWSCWIVDKIYWIYKVGTSLIWWGLLFGFFTLVAWGIYKLYAWWQDKALREKQDVFELVEQVLSLLVAQHQASGRTGGVAHSYLAINHIRDQLIAPQDRKRKKKLWDKVVNYIRESESRVREEVQVVYGEENRVWRWIPDMTWGTSINPTGPNPYIVSPAVTTSSTTMFPPTPVPPFITPTNMAASSTPSTSTVTTTGKSWQGSAFSSLNKNVAAPSMAPTPCLKVRHMFDHKQRSRSNSRSWLMQLRDDVVTRCANAAILHIAIDTESTEGCVYIKARTTEDAHKIFLNLHGQWYGGNLITAKYMRLERYHERFPESKHQYFPLRVEPKIAPL